MTFVAELGGVSTLRPKAARLRDPPLRMFLAASLSGKLFLLKESMQFGILLIGCVIVLVTAPSKVNPTPS